MLFAATLAMLLTAGAGAAQWAPSKPIRMIVPFTAGSATDIVARMIGPKILENWGQPVVVDNRPSAGGTVAGGIVAKAAPDGHTLMFTSSQFAGSAALYSKLPYDPLRDFTGITQIADAPFILVVAPGLGVKSVKELIALAQQKPGQINFGSSGIGSGTHYAGERFKLSARIDVVHVPYKGTPEALNDTVAGRVQYMVSALPPSVPLIKSGRLLALAVTTAQRTPSLPDVPTIADAGLHGAECFGWYGVFAPSKTPQAIITALSRGLTGILEQPDLRERIISQGVIPKPTTPEEFDRMVRGEIQLRKKIFGASGAKVE